MSDAYKLQYNGMTLAYPGWNGYVGYKQPSGTYYDVLFKAANVTAAPKSGELTHSIYDYDMIKIFPAVDSQQEQYYGIEYAPKDIVVNYTTPHIFKTQGGGNIYLQDLKIKFPTETSFDYQVDGEYYAISSTMGTIGTTTLYNKAMSNWAKDNQGVSMIIGVKYQGTRDLLYSGTSMDAELPLSKPFTAYDRLQIKISNPIATSANTVYEHAGYWTEWAYTSGTNCHLNYIGGEGGSCLWYQKSCVLSNNTTFSGGKMKPLVWTVINTAAPGVSPNNSAVYNVTEIWGLK
jgi:hypothetical protein